MIIDMLVTGLAGFIPDEFPEAQDFTVEVVTLFETDPTNSTEILFRYIVTSPPIEVGFAWMLERTEVIRAWELTDVPNGTLTEPYHDSDQGWNIMIWQQDEKIFVAEGDGVYDYERDADTYARWFTVSAELYCAGWAAALAEVRAAAL